MTDVLVQRHRTAMNRSLLSRPVALAYKDGVINGTSSVFDYGCGRGGDVRHLRSLGVEATGWDPNHIPAMPRVAADIVNLGYVINVIEDRSERDQALKKTWKLARAMLVVATRPAWEARDVRGQPHGDGILTAKDTFQKFFEQDKLRAYAESTLGHRAVAAAPGVFYVFRDESAAQAMLAFSAHKTTTSEARRVTEVIYELHRDVLFHLKKFIEARRCVPLPGEINQAVAVTIVEEFESLRSAFLLIRRATEWTRWIDVEAGTVSQSERRFVESRELLEPLMTFVEQRGRLPHPIEIEAGVEVEVTFGSIRAAFALVRRATGSERCAEANKHARRNFLVYLALSAFEGRPRFSELPDELQLDVRELFGTYKKAVAEADLLLYVVGDLRAVAAAAQGAPVGKLTGEAPLRPRLRNPVVTTASARVRGVRTSAQWHGGGGNRGQAA